MDLIIKIDGEPAQSPDQLKGPLNSSTPQQLNSSTAQRHKLEILNLSTQSIRHIELSGSIAISTRPESLEGASESIYRVTSVSKPSLLLRLKPHSDFLICSPEVVYSSLEELSSFSRKCLKTELVFYDAEDGQVHSEVLVREKDQRMGFEVAGGLLHGIKGVRAAFLAKEKGAGNGGSNDGSENMALKEEI